MTRPILKSLTAPKLNSLGGWILAAIVIDGLLILLGSAIKILVKLIL